MIVTEVNAEAEQVAAIKQRAKERMADLDRQINFFREQLGVTGHPGIVKKIANAEREKREIEKCLKEGAMYAGL